MGFSLFLSNRFHSTISATQSSEVMKHAVCPEDVTGNLYLSFVFHSAAEM